MFSIFSHFKAFRMVCENEKLNYTQCKNGKNMKPKHSSVCNLNGRPWKIKILRMASISSFLCYAGSICEMPKSHFQRFCEPVITSSAPLRNLDSWAHYHSIPPPFYTDSMHLTPRCEPAGPHLNILLTVWIRGFLRASSWGSFSGWHFLADVLL